MDGGKKLQEEVVRPPEEPTAVTIKCKDRWNRYFHFIRPKTISRTPFGAPDLELGPDLLAYGIEDETRQATHLTIKFSEYRCTSANSSFAPSS